MSMTIICESQSNLSELFSGYKIVKWVDLDKRYESILEFVKWDDLDRRLEFILRLDLAWTIDDFDDYCTGAYLEMIYADSITTITELEKLLYRLADCCTKIVLFYWFGDIYKTISMIPEIFADKNDFIQFVKSSIYYDYRCMFNCIYQKTDKM